MPYIDEEDESHVKIEEAVDLVELIEAKREYLQSQPSLELVVEIMDLCHNIMNGVRRLVMPGTKKCHVRCMPFCHCHW